RKLGVGRKDLYLLKDVGKIAAISIFAGIITFAVYQGIKDFMPAVGENLARMLFAAPKRSVVDFIWGSLTLGISFAVFAPIYLLAAYFWNVIDDEEKQTVRNVFSRLRTFLKREPIPNPQSQIPN
ncbi:MAG TPA: hypothetical protein VK892_02145, partial [Pyrinomonadaceae bacterium]|nr:hypothetical protein [Pyrinomonadaceae bacterium]